VDSYALSEAYKLVALDAAEEARRRRRKRDGANVERI